MPKLANDQHELFCLEYLKDFNGGRAAIAAGYSSKSDGHMVNASRILARDDVKARLAELSQKKCEKLEITSERVLAELAKLGFANMEDYIGRTPSGDIYTDFSKLTREQAAAIQEITVDEYTEGRGDAARDVKRVKFKLAEKRGSLELLGKYLKLFVDRQELTGPDGGPVEHTIKFGNSAANER